MVYSDLCIEPQSGDTAGQRLYVLPAGALPRVYLQWTEGGLTEAEPAEFELVDGRLSFTFSGGADITSFSGEVYPDYAVISTREPGAPLHTLPRAGRADAGDRYPACKPLLPFRPRL